MKATIILSDGEVRKAIHDYLVRNGVSDQMAGDVVVQIDTQKDMQRDQVRGFVRAAALNRIATNHARRAPGPTT